MSIQQVNQVVVRNTRLRTTEAWKAVGKDPNVSTSALQLIAVLLQRIEDLEIALGYEPEFVVFGDMQKVDTQGR